MSRRKLTLLILLGWSRLSRQRVMEIIALALFTALVGWFVYLGRPAPAVSPRLGVSFSSRQASELGLDPVNVYLAILDELGVRELRLAAYWDAVQPQPDQFDFSELDWQLDEAARRGAKVLLAVGRKLPRWPECFTPSWALKLSAAEQEAQLLSMLNTVVSRYAEHPALYAWQLENEPFVAWFGRCPSPNQRLLRAEREVVHRLSDKPIVITDSGELSSWRRAAHFGTVFGTTMYRATWNSYFGYWFYPLPAAFYRAKARFWGLTPTDVLITELQAEPWPPGTLIIDTPLHEQLRTMDVERFRGNIRFARATGFGAIYLWGSEWWYWLKEKQGQPEIWEAAKQFFATESQ